MRATGPMTIDFTGRRALITGGSRGIAGCIAREFARNGAAIAINYSAAADDRAGVPQAAMRLVDETRSSGGVAHAIEADLLTPGSATALVSRAAELLGAIDILVLSASIQVHKDFLDMDDADVAAQFQINLVSNIQILQRVIPAMRAEGWGRIITLGSVQEVAPSAEMPIYAMTKAAQENLVRNLAVQNAPYGITVNNVAPGLVMTDRNAFRRRDMNAWDELAANANPLGRAGLPEDVSGAVLFLASDSAAFVTGATLFATGGAHIPWARSAPSHGTPLHRPTLKAGE